LKQKPITSAVILSLIFTLASANAAIGSVLVPIENPSTIMSAAVQASFFFVPIIPYTNVTVNFDASGSKSGNGFITNYGWDFGDGTPPVNEVDPFATHMYVSPGDYLVTLTVTDSIGESGSLSKSLSVIVYPSGAWIDLYTQRGGEGLYQASGTFAPGERVTLFGLVTYNSEPVVNKLVAFEVHDPTGTGVLVRTAETNSFGVAEINFTIPSASPPEQIIGTWVAFAVASISEQTISDTVPFRVSGLMIDVYTQKPDPYSGKGPGMPSDAFGPQEEVILYAYVTFDLEPIANKMVAFEVLDPKGGVFYRENNTNAEGIATVRFRIPWMGNEATELFGIWHIRAWVEVIGMIAEDTLTFLFGWIIEIKEFETVDSVGQSKTDFMRGEHIYFNLTVNNIAFVSKVAAFTMVAYDTSGVPIGHMALRSWVVPSGTLQIFIVDLQIPSWAFIGFGRVFANAYTDLPQFNGVPYSPEVSVLFTIIL